MRVAIDLSPLRLTRAGTARYLRILLDELEGRDDVEVAPIAWGGAGRATAALRDAAWYPLGLPRAAREADLLHCPSYRAPLRSTTPLVVTVHDLALFRHPEVFNRWSRAYGRFAVPRVVRAARLLIAVSEFTRDELVELLAVDRERIRVVPNGISTVFRPDGPAAEGDYVLAVGTLEPRKNLPRLIEATRGLDAELRIVGAPGWGDVDVGESHVHWLGEVPDEELAVLYRGARCVAYPSLYEGFGYPIAEAMACGTPVVTSAGGATEEIAGGAAVLVDPLDAESIRAGIEDAIARRGALVPQGLERAKAFAPDRFAAATVDVYREALRNPNVA
ncbi:MAG: glycosyltransferase family 1 protein [Thermoleophilia bacterium]